MSEIRILRKDLLRLRKRLDKIFDQTLVLANEYERLLEARRFSNAVDVEEMSCQFKLIGLQANNIKLYSDLILQRKHLESRNRILEKDFQDVDPEEIKKLESMIGNVPLGYNLGD